MSDVYSFPEMIQWHEGMLLEPQHFQQLSFRHEELLHYHLRLCSPFHWGIRRLKIDQTRLIEGTLRILELEAIMPDGLVVHRDHTDEDNLEVNLEPYNEDMKKGPVTVHLGVPGIRSGDSVVKGPFPRYRSVEGLPVPDENTGDQEISIPRLKPCLTLLVTETPARKYSAFPLMKIGYRNEAIAPTDYIPPILNVSTDIALWDICSSIARRIREKGIFLAERLDSPYLEIRGFMALQTRLFVQNLVASLPSFEAVINTGVAHPYHIYVELCSIAGNIASIGRRVPPVFEPYDHNDIRTVFENLRNFIFKIMDEGISESHTAIPFEFKNNMFSLELKESWMSNRLLIGIRKRLGVSEKETIQWIEESLIGSDTKIDSMKERRILGAERERVEIHEKFVPARGVFLFLIRVEPEFVLPKTRLLIFNVSGVKEIRPLDIMLYVKNRSVTDRG